MQIERLEEFQIDRHTQVEITALLKMCFSEYPDRSYYKQVPNFRYLVWEDELLIGHLAVSHRMINVAGTLASIFGVIDICIHNEYQHNKIATTLLQDLDKLAKKHKIDFIVLTADEHELYEKNGFKLVKNTCRWLMINDHQTLGVAHRTIDDCIMIKAMQDKEWKTGLVDFLGLMV